MAKIVVADDNSNIQRMVGLALKDQGIDVVAVGNGEAAVRKISELHPDLVLADVFMPVRNGYEVCQYVKQDPKLAHIPVILLVGAFDPLDEQEAQRVGADGVLKKPFVPPDPLIAMVKAALFRAGVSLTPSTAEKGLGTPPPPPPSRGIFPTPPPPMPSSRRQLDVVPPKSPTPISPLSGVSFSGSSSKTPTPQAPETVFDDENLVETISRPEPVQIDAARNTMAFGDLLQPVSNNEAPDFVVPTKPEIADDWNALEEPDEVPEEEEEESQESASTWRPEAPEGVFTADDTKGPVEDWRDSPVLQNVGRKSLRETWESAGHKTEDHAAESKGGFVNAADVPTEVDNTFVMETVPVETEPQRSNLRESPVHDSAVQDVAAHDVAAQEFRPHDVETESNPVSKTPAVSAFTTEPHGTEREAQKTETHRPEFVAEKSDADVLAEAYSGSRHVQEAPPVPAPEKTADVEEKKPAGGWLSRLLNPWDAGASKENSVSSGWYSANTPTFESAVTPAKPEKVEEQKSETYQEAERSVREAVDQLSRESSQVNAQVSSQESSQTTSHEHAQETSVGGSHVAGTENAHATYTQPAIEIVPGQATASAQNGSSVNGTSSHAAAVNGTAANGAKADAPETDALVAKVLAQLSPEVLQAVTREILKPVVAAMVAEELKAKK